MGSSSSSQVGPVHQRQRQPQALLHAQREVFELLLPGTGQPHIFQRLLRHMPAGDAPLEAVIFQVLTGSQVGVKTGRLHHDAGALAHLAQLPLPGGPEQLDLPVGGDGLGCDHTDYGGFARTVAAHQAVDLPCSSDRSTWSTARWFP